MAKEDGTKPSDASITSSVLSSLLNGRFPMSSQDPVECVPVPVTEVVIQQAHASPREHTADQNYAEVSVYDAPMNHSGGGREGLDIWRKMRPHAPRKLNDHELEEWAQSVRDAFINAVGDEYQEAVEELGRIPLILQKITPETDIPDNALRMTNSKGENSYWREATAHDILEHIKSCRHKSCRNGPQQGNENQDENVENRSQHKQDMDMPDAEDEPNYDSNAVEVESVCNASMCTFSLSMLSETWSNRPSRANFSTLSEETKSGLNNRNIVLTEADMRDLIYGKCQNIYDFLAVYRSNHYQRCLGRIRQARSTLGRDEFSKQWAEALSNENHEADLLNSDRRICLWLLYAMCDRWGGPSNESHDSKVTEADIINVFRRESILNILSECLPMDRANAWYNLVESGSQGQRGVHWYARDHHDWYLAHGHGRDHEHTMNKRLVWLIGIQGLHLAGNKFVKELMQPARTPLAPVDETSTYTS